ncbi:MAG: TatD family hydrolase [Acholeplasmatales bacterium]|jgi:TatD DNase family protein|nr:TatD family hydrolase [Acholeplasmatales bacterium]
MIDTHTHLYFKDYPNVDETIHNALKAKVTQMISVAINYETSLESLRLAKKYSKVIYPSAGVHPSELASFNAMEFDNLLQKAHQDFIAIGEVGLDYHYEENNKEQQKQVFRYFIELSIKYHLPLIIHSREAFDDTLTILQEYKGQVWGVFHCFTGSLDQAKQIVALNFCLGIGGVLTFKSASDLVEVVQTIDLKHLILETDCPFLAPMPYRGKTNEPAYVGYVLEKIITLRKEKNVEQTIESTTRKLFNFSLNL